MRVASATAPRSSGGDTGSAAGARRRTSRTSQDSWWVARRMRRRPSGRRSEPRMGKYSAAHSASGARSSSHSRPPANSSTPPSSPWAAGSKPAGRSNGSSVGRTDTTRSTRNSRSPTALWHQPDRYQWPAALNTSQGSTLRRVSSPREADQYSISTRWPVAAARASSVRWVVSAGSPSRSTETLPASSCTRSSWSAGSTASSLARARARAPCSATSGRASRARPARYSPAASRQVSRGARANQSAKPMWTLSPSTQASIRSPGPYGGTPVTYSSSRSAISVSRVMSKRSQTSSTVAPGWSSTQGTRASSRWRRPAALASGVLAGLIGAPQCRWRPGWRPPSSPDHLLEGLEAAAGLVAEVGRLDDLDAVAHGPAEQAVAVANRQAQGDQAVGPGRAGGHGPAQLGQAGRGPGRPDQGHRRPLGLAGGGQDLARVEAGRDLEVGPAAGRAELADVGGDPRHPERAQRVPVGVVADHVPGAPPVDQGVGVEAALGRLPARGPVAEHDPLAARDRLQQHGQQRAGPVQVGPQGVRTGSRVEVELGQPGHGGRVAGRARPGPGGKGQGGPLVGGQVQLGHAVGLGVDEVAFLAPPGVDRGPLDRHPEPAQLLLVPLEHAPPAVQQQGDEVDEPLHLAHAPMLVELGRGRGGRCPGWNDGASLGR